jgi:PLP dependent protein
VTAGAALEGSPAPDPDLISVLAAARARVLETIERAAAKSDRDPASVRLVAVTKTVPVDRIRAAVAAGLTVLGENRVQEAADKAALVSGATWHLVGPLQSNKVRRAVETFDVVESVDSVDLARRLDRIVRDARGLAVEGPVPGAGRLAILLQANVDDDQAKAGFLPGELAAALPTLLDLGALQIDGLMTIGRLVDDPEAARSTFRRLREFAADLRGAEPRLGPELSMGMSDDFPVAIEEGATIVRVGRALFGERPTVDGLQ